IVVCDEVDFGVVVAAERLGLPYASVQSTASGSVVPTGVVAEQANQLRVEHGLPPDPGLEMLRRYLVLVPFPPSLRDPGCPLPPTAHELRHVSSDLPLDERAFPWTAVAEVPPGRVAWRVWQRPCRPRGPRAGGDAGACANGGLRRARRPNLSAERGTAEG